ncbi:N-acyl homoserine lactonase family protein [Marilutibacter alkalisoli]|uniref:N-acyl homoserine lactonase family protein n=1 Tax=Marilutibacter alkalisoli TaxID=2591633 RepID=A0A514BP95_9GAMM|nr:N-acyl homoserine lactonase family protein [Lysobacter alkalisoli]QDH69211.1 N-acyl homoserine lactonase family protein [Lysobacter alkalisoli]
MTRSIPLFVSLTAALAAMPASAADEVDGVRLYALDCGRLEFRDMTMFSDTGEYDGKPESLVDTCFLVRHPKGTLMWDTGLGDAMAEHEDGVNFGDSLTMHVDVRLVEQLDRIGLRPADITYVAFSHLHFDHTGNANLFSDSTWITSNASVAWAMQDPAPFGVDQDSFSALMSAKRQQIDGDHDVFGDGTVRILKTPGHTPGHQSLEISLAEAGTVILSGDLYHTHANRHGQRVPRINVDRADTLASMNRVEAIVENTGARFVIQHDRKDFESLPKFPAYLD